MFKFGKADKGSLDADIKAELEKLRKLSAEDLKRVYGGGVGDTRKEGEYSMNSEDINRSIYGALYDD